MAKFRQLGWMCVAPTPFTQSCADGGRSERRDVDPVNTTRTVPSDEGAVALPHASVARLVAAAASRVRACTE